MLCHFGTQVATGELQNVIVNLPPQHGKTEPFSRSLPAFALGLNPDTKIVHTSYAAELVQGLNRDNQRTMDGLDYQRLFPATRLNSTNVRTVSGSWLRNNDIFEVVDRRGSYRCAGVGGGISGYPGDLGLIDDPIKDYKEALSPTIRRAVWEWYTSTFLARMHNGSRQAIIMTRWHPEDLAGMLIDRQPKKWRVVRLPALCEDPDEELRLWREVEPSATKPPRAEGDALWPERFSREHLLEKRALNPHQFDGLYQQRPKARDGNLFKYDQLAGPDRRLSVRPMGHDVRRVRYWDLAGTMRPGGDRTSGTLGAFPPDRRFIVEDVAYGRWNVDERNERILATARRDRADAERNGWPEPVIWIEKPMGVNADGMERELARKLAGFPVHFEAAKKGKVVRAEPMLGYAQGMNVYIVDAGDGSAAWITDWVEEMTAFTGAENGHDDMVDSTSGCFNKVTETDAIFDMEFI